MINGFLCFSARLKYMLDVLTAIKNNNVNRIPNYDPTLAEHLRKILKTLCINGKYVTTLNISLEDLVNVQNRGKWWVVGSAWTGNINDISSAAKATSSKKTEQKFSEQLLELARKQRMNTDERRNVFCILMSAEVSVVTFILWKLYKLGETTGKNDDKFLYSWIVTIRLFFSF